jgi:hypothetical protein
MSDLSDLFKLVAEEKKKKKEEMESLIGDSFDKLFVEQLKSHKSPKELAIKHEVSISQIKKQIKKGVEIEKEHTKDTELATKIASQHIDELPDYYDRLSKVEKNNSKDPVSLLEKGLISLKNISYSSIDKLMRTICDNYNISPRKLHDDFVKKHKVIPDEWIKNKKGIKEEVQEIKEEPKEKVLHEGLLNILPQEKTPDPLTPLNQNYATLDDLQNHYKLFLNRIQQQLSTLGGGGETRLEFLDDVDRNSAKTDGYYLKYDASSGKWVGDVTSVVSITGITTYYQASNTDDYIGVSANVPVTIVLPLSPSIGKKITVKDEGNNISTYNITVQTGIGQSVENNTSVIMNSNHQSFTYFYNGSNWYII